MEKYVIPALVAMVGTVAGIAVYEFAVEPALTRMRGEGSNAGAGA